MWRWERRCGVKVGAIHARTVRSSVSTERRTTRLSREGRDSLAVTGSYRYETGGHVTVSPPPEKLYVRQPWYQAMSKKLKLVIALVVVVLAYRVVVKE